MLRTRYNDTRNHHLLVNKLKEYGGTVTKRYEQISQRLDNLVQDKITGAVQQLADAVMAGTTGTDLIPFIANANTEVTNNPQALAQAREIIFETLETEYLTNSATKNYETARQHFNNIGKRFKKATTIAPAGTTANDIATGTAEQRAAWIDTQALPNELDKAWTQLRLAAAATGKITDTGEHYLGLAINPQQAKRRDIWQAWTADQHWTAILNTGAIIEAPELDKHEPYREPKPLEYRQLRIPDGYGSIGNMLYRYEDATFDPELLDANGEPTRVA
ncbi:hypothetical protein [Gulosibacter bifidus]|uniref:Uncharacterized protein n=1 Tax=Gulosibacter bifidus TaxID=272239 RepID=A0ABW5RIR2_9MICO|nr:hypothetical protein [Gulosibacter bifidus]